MSMGNFRTLIIANPQSANGSLGKSWFDCAHLIRGNFGSFDSCLTTGSGDAALVTRQALQEHRYEMIVAMGGDGTISEVADGFFDRAGPRSPDTVLGVLPFGTGGDFRKTMGVPKGLAAGARCLRGKKTRHIDIGKITYTTPEGHEELRHFINIASFGIGGLVDQLVNSTTKIFGGRISFALATVRALSRFKPQRAIIQLDETEPREIILQSVAVANGRFFGGGMFIAPHAELDDGLFDVVTIGPASLIDTIIGGPKLYRGSHLELPQIEVRRARRVVARPVEPGEDILLDVDGETPGRLPATFEVMTRSLRLKIPR